MDDNQDILIQILTNIAWRLGEIDTDCRDYLQADIDALHKLIEQYENIRPFELL